MIWPERFSQGIDLTESFFINILLSQFSHLGWSHLLLNAAGLYVITWGLAQDWPVKEWAFLVLASLFACPVWLTWIEPIHWYTGLSGALHAQFTALLVIAIVQRKQTSGSRNWVLWILLAGLMAKLLIEFQAPAGVSDQTIGGPIAYSAHRGGVVFGGLLACLLIYSGRNFGHSASPDQ